MSLLARASGGRRHSSAGCATNSWARRAELLAVASLSGWATSSLFCEEAVVPGHGCPGTSVATDVAHGDALHPRSLDRGSNAAAPWVPPLCPAVSSVDTSVSSHCFFCAAASAGSASADGAGFARRLLLLPVEAASASSPGVCSGEQRQLLLRAGGEEQRRPR